ncbi:MAG: hypothetical protein ABIG95_04540 [Candidatus Woesearchaeota archaeon]
MAFDKNLDKTLFSETAEFDATKVTVSVHSYNEAQPKLQISRENINPMSGEWRWSKLGRLTKDEVVAIMPLVEKALGKM